MPAAFLEAVDRLVNYQPPFGFLNNLSAILLAYSYICGRT